MTETGGSYAVPVCAEMHVALGAMDQARKEMLCDLWHRFTCGAGRLAIVDDLALPAHTGMIGTAECTLEAADAYAITASESGVCIKGTDDLGLLHGMYTLLQMIRPVCLKKGSEELRIDCAAVHDHPAMSMRSLHVCIFPETTLMAVEKLIRLAAFMKFTHVCIEFWGTLKLDCFPEMAWPEKSFSKSEFKPMIDLCHAMGMEVIPMKNHLGHAPQSRGGMGRHTVLDQNPRLADLFEPDGWTWCLSNPVVHEKLREMRDELMEFCGESSYFHLGCDESYSYASCPKCRDKDHIAMLVDFLNGLAEELAQKGRRGIIWGDQLLDQTQWKRPVIATSRPDQKTHLALEKLDRRLVIADWQYYLETPEIPSSDHFQKAGFDTLICPWYWPNNAVAMHAGAEKLQLMGTMVTTWHHLDPMLRMMPELGGSAWSGEAYKTNPGQRVHCGALLRKLMPVSRSFEKSGFMTHEIDAGYNSTLY